MGLRWCGGVLAAVWLLGCASSGGSGAGGGGTVRDSSFPSAEELEDLRQAPGPTRVFEPGLRDVETWRLSGPFPARMAVDPWVDDAPASRRLAELAATRPGLVVPTEAMHCVAREMGLFYLEHDARPPDALRRSIRALCRSPVARVSFGFLRGQVPKGASDEAVLEAWGDAVSEAIRGQLVGGPRTAGVWLGRHAGQAILMVAAGERLLHLEPVSHVDGGVVLEGEALVPVREVGGAVTRGRLGYSVCELDPELALPRFRMSCPLDPADSRVWLAVSIHPPERLIGRTGAELLLWPGERVDPVYHRPSYTESRQAWDEDTTAAGFVALLNQLREAEGLEALVYDEAQSEIARDLAPHFFEANFGRVADSVADLVMLGLLAGWSVDGIVQAAHFSASWVSESNDVGRLLSEALDHPMNRRALLADDAERIAVGPVLEADGDTASMAVVVGTYALFSEERHASQAKQVFERLGEERAARGRRAPRRLEELRDLSTAMAGAVQAGSEPREALHELLNESGRQLGRSVRGWILESTRLEDIAFPEELLDEAHVSVSIGVSSYQPEGEAWGRHVVLIVAAEPGRGI